MFCTDSLWTIDRMERCGDPLARTLWELTDSSDCQVAWVLRKGKNQRGRKAAWDLSAHPEKVVRDMRELADETTKAHRVQEAEKREWVAYWKDEEMAERLEEKAVLQAGAVARAFEEGAKAIMEKELATFVAVDAAQAASMAKVLCK